MSKWLMLKPAKANPWKPTATVSKVTALSGEVPKYPQRRRNVAPNEKATWETCEDMMSACAVHVEYMRHVYVEACAIHVQHMCSMWRHACVPIVVIIFRTVPVDRIFFRRKSAMTPLIGTKVASRMYGIAEYTPASTID